MSAPSTYESRSFVDVGSARLWVEILGQGPTVLVCHGGPGISSRYLHDPLARALGDRTRLVFVDQRGSGRSSGVEVPDTLTMASLVADHCALTSTLGITRPIVLGHSFGGLLALHVALARPGALAGLVLVDSDPASRREWRLHETRVRERLAEDERAEMAALTEAPGWHADPERLARYLDIHLGTYVFDRARTPDVGIEIDDRTVRALGVTGPRIREDLGDWDLTGRLGEVDCPTLVVHGRESIFPVATAETLANGIPGATLSVIDACGHFPFLEAPDAFRDAVVGFIRERC